MICSEGNDASTPFDDRCFTRRFVADVFLAANAVCKPDKSPEFTAQLLRVAQFEAMHVIPR